jgi:exopolyphosphatase/guanosine-5'-triphosphate,3'-diphosphate pyrophosphatase
MTDSATRKPQRLAAIDIGSNTIRLVVVEVDADGTYRVLDEEREQTRLSRGLQKTGKLDKDSMERSLEALGRMKQIADGYDVAELRAIATAAVRSASNRRTFRRQAARRHGLDVQVVSARNEARLAFLSMGRQFNLDGTPVAMVDIGGGSVEIVLAAGTVVDRIYSLPLGAVRLTEGFGESDPWKDRDWRKLNKAIDKSIKRRVGKPPINPQVMVGSGGTFTALGGMVKYEREGRADGVQGYPIARAEVVSLVNRLREMPEESRKQVPGLSPDRADIIVAGAAAIARLAKHLGCRQILVNEGGVREGLLLSMIAERTRGKRIPGSQFKDRMEWVRLFARKCGSNEMHCDHVAFLATQIFDGLQETYELEPEGRELLVAAALLHEIGYLISHAKHHKHAYHLIMHGDLPGYSAREVELIANIARYHRRAYPKKSHENLASLGKADRRMVRQLSAILRVADGLDRTHARTITAIAVEHDDDATRLLLESQMQPRVEMWDADRKAGLFEKVYRSELEFHWVERDEKPALRSVS